MADDGEDWQLMSTAAAAIAGCSVDTVKAHAKRGTLPSRTIANGWRVFRRSDVETWAMTLRRHGVVADAARGRLE